MSVALRIDAERRARDDVALPALSPAAVAGQPLAHRRRRVLARHLPSCTLRWPDLGDWGVARTGLVRCGASAALLVVWRPVRRFWPARRSGCGGPTPWLLALGLFFSLWQVATAKFACAAAAVLPAAAGPARSLHRRLPSCWTARRRLDQLQLLRLTPSARAVGFRDRRAARLVARGRLLGASGAAADRAAAGDRLAAARVLRLPRPAAAPATS